VYFKIVAASGGYRAYIMGGNNEIIFWSEVYSRPEGAAHAVSW
jgi:uncharacterized protein YegP (UPF0339 family)